jgi:hypothetical protein
MMLDASVTAMLCSLHFQRPEDDLEFTRLFIGAKRHEQGLVFDSQETASRFMQLLNAAITNPLRTVH